MSKAFLRESDFDDLPDTPAPVLTLPPGTKNYMTEAGAARLRGELQRMVDHERPPLAADPGDVEARRTLQALDRRIRHLQHSLQSAEIIPSSRECDDTVRFGCTVTVRDETGLEETYRIVGVDETDFAPDHISWQSPLAKALLNARVGDEVRFAAPRGPRTLTILAVG